jgi:hypothetical protein
METATFAIRKFIKVYTFDGAALYFEKKATPFDSALRMSSVLLNTRILAIMAFENEAKLYC